MLKVKVQEGNGWARKRARFAFMPKAIRGAVIGALNETVDDLHLRHTKEMKTIFDRPTPYMLRGLRRQKVGHKGGGFNAPAGINNPRPAAGPIGNDVGARYSVLEAGIGFDYFGLGGGIPPETVIKPHVFGGARRQKPFERSMARSALIPASYYAVPAASFKKNQYGNVPGSVVAEVLASIGSLSREATPSRTAGAKEGAQRTKRRRKAFNYFVHRNERNQLSIRYYRGGSGPKVAFWITPTVQYRKRYDFFSISSRQVKASVPYHFIRIVNRYMSKVVR